MRFMVLFITGCSVNQSAVPRFEDVDLMGSTLESKKMPSEAQCQELCVQTDKCVGYTYGGPKVKEQSRGRCYLKRHGFKYLHSKGFQSGIKR